MNKKESFSAHSILITGASSGIGQSLARFYAQPGRTLFLWGRSTDKLEKTAQLCRDKGADVHIYVINLSIPSDAIKLLNKILTEHTIDMAILAAGSGDIKREAELLEDPENLLQLTQLNYTTPSLMANIIAHQMITRHIQGKIVLIGSVAGFHSLPFATGYSSSKAGIARFADSLRLAVKKCGVSVTLISPGFIDTPMSQRLDCDKPFLMGLNEATLKITDAIDNNKRELILPSIFNILKWIDRLAPASIKDFILSNIKVKQD
ncbi:SDR family NAD(P)-dependent oxidoreductase [Commensalibacter oyaizuii]|uniref:SDR family NAD(P)-dependent oxidoreductase n=1 Tax=Commensalibacter oyaizuii TaxID=3043873 RepID=A0ABT6PZK1_9PROT|nr:SDR family NAD(P)-dependent oxidoreductase [Commensalibacter sp. TBRC 16381]MDI2090290.1 SDR family NAD(P)-dependent oxidoreductase [Commensalibacter sp. TBRC 16381]